MKKISAFLAAVSIVAATSGAYAQNNNQPTNLNVTPEAAAWTVGLLGLILATTGRGTTTTTTTTRP